MSKNYLGTPKMPELKNDYLCLKIMSKNYVQKLCPKVTWSLQKCVRESSGECHDKCTSRKCPQYPTNIILKKTIEN